MAFPKCIACNSEMKATSIGWIFSCPSCDLQQLASSDDQKVDHFNRSLHFSAHKKHRRSLLEQLLEIMISADNLKMTRVLDVGCGYGWFLDLLDSQDCWSVGLDKDFGFVFEASQNGQRVLVGQFPHSPFRSGSFDWIVFNDVFEHLEDLPSVCSQCFDLLKPGGMLSILAPNSQGLLYRVATMLARMGYSGPLERLWLRRYPFPHLTYFSRVNLSCLLNNFGFTEIVYSGLPYTPPVSLANLKEIVRIDKTIGSLQSVVLALGLMILRPIAMLGAPDSFVSVYRKNERN